MNSLDARRGGSDAATEVPPFRLTFSDEVIEEFADVCSAILRDGVLTLSSRTQEFEGLVARMAGTRHAVALTSGTTALELLLRALDPPLGAVLLPSNTNAATAAAAVASGRRIQLYDAGLYATAASIAEAITDSTAAVIVVHIGGFVSPEIAAIASLCKGRGLPLVEDAAHAHGSTRQGRPAGSWGDGAGFSFFPTKVVTTAEGGAVTCDDDALADRVRQLRNQGKGGSVLDLIGGSFRMSEFSAALGSAQLRRLEETSAQQGRIFAAYCSALEATKGLSPVQPQEGDTVSGYKFIAIADDAATRTEFIQFSRNKGVSMGGAVYDTLISHDRRFEPHLLPGGLMSFPDAEDFAARHLCLPAWPLMPTEFQSAVEGVLQGFRR